MEPRSGGSVGCESGERLMATMTLKELALEAHLKGVPSTLPDSNPNKGVLEDHRWGKHGIVPELWCIACQLPSGGQRSV